MTITHGQQINATNTGLAGAGITPSSLPSQGATTYSTDNSVISGIKFTGTVTLAGNNITLKNCWISLPANPNGQGISSNGTGNSIQFCKVDTSSGSGYIGIHHVSGSNIWIYRCDISLYENNITIDSDGALIEETYAHDSSNVSNTAGHRDCVELYHGNGHTIRKSRLMHPTGETSVVNIAPYSTGSSMTNIAIDDTFLDGGNRHILVDLQSTGTITYVRVRRNIMGGHTFFNNYDPFQDNDNRGTVETEAALTANPNALLWPTSGVDINTWGECSNLSPDYTNWIVNPTGGAIANPNTPKSGSDTATGAEGASATPVSANLTLTISSGAGLADASTLQAVAILVSDSSGLTEATVNTAHAPATYGNILYGTKLYGTQVANADAATSSDSASVVVRILTGTAADAGNGADSGTLLAQPLVADTASAVDASVPLAVTSTTSDSALGVEATFVQAVAPPVSDTASLVSEVVSIGVSSFDIGSGADSTSGNAVGLLASDTASGTESGPLIAQASSDTSSSADVATGFFGPQVSDLGAGVDVLTVVTKFLTDAGSALDVAGAVAASVPAPDTATGTEATSIVAIAPTTGDDAAGLETESVFYQLFQIVSDTGSGVELTALTVLAADTGSAADALTLAPLADDTGSGVESSALQRTSLLAAADTGAGSQAASATVTTSTSDTANTVDAAFPAVTTSSSDTAVAVDAGRGGSAAFEFAVAVETTSLSVTGLLPTDSAAGVESASVATNLSVFDIFTGADGSPWSSYWVQTLSPSGGGATIQGNQGQLKTGNTGGYSAADRISEVANITAPTDAEIYCEFTYDTTEAYAELAIRANRTLDFTYGYYLSLYKTGQVYLKKRAAADTAVTTLGTIPITITNGVQYKARFRVQGPFVSASVWPGNGVEPSNWQKMVQDYAVTQPGYIGVTAAGGSAAVSDTVLFDDVQINDLTTVSTPLAAADTGSVADATGIAIAPVSPIADSGVGTEAVLGIAVGSAEAASALDDQFIDLSLSDAATGLEEALTPLVVWYLTPSDSVGLVEVEFADDATFGADDCGLGDAVVLAALPVASDGAGLADSLDTLSTHVLVVPETTGLSETIVAQALLTRSFADVSNLTDGLLNGKLYAVSLSDPMSVTDSITPVRVAGYALNDLMQLDTTYRFDATFTVSDVTALTDTLTPARGLPLTVADSAGSADASTQGYGRVLALSGDTGLADTTTTSSTFALNISDDMQISSDAVSMGRSATLIDVLAMNDGYVPLRTLSAALNDTMPITDGAAARWDLDIIESVGMADTGTGHNKTTFNLRRQLTVNYTDATRVMKVGAHRNTSGR